MTQIIANVGFAKVENQLLRNHKNMTNLLHGFESSEKPKYLLKAIANLENRINALRSKIAT